MKKVMFWCIIVGLLGWSCHQNKHPKPKGYLALQFPPHHYRMLDNGCPYRFLINKITRLKPSLEHRPCMLDIEYPNMKGTIYITYEPVHHNLRKLLKDAQKLPLKHTIKADQIMGSEYTNSSHHTYGMLYTVTGNAASQYQFYLTDSSRNFMTGSVYFRMEPNYDSIYPAAVYLKTDVKKIMESLQWKNR